MSDKLLILGVPAKQTLASNREELARLCGVSVSTIARALASGNSPGKRQNGVYDVEKWRDFLAAKGADDGETPEAPGAWELRRRKLTAAVEYEEARAERERLELEEKRGKLLDCDKVRTANNTAIEALRTALVKEIGVQARDAEQYRLLSEAVDAAFNAAAKAVEMLEMKTE